jgi:hypothetical protein
VDPGDTMHPFLGKTIWLLVCIFAAVSATGSRPDEETCRVSFSVPASPHLSHRQSECSFMASLADSVFLGENLLGQRAKATSFECIPDVDERLHWIATSIRCVTR